MINKEVKVITCHGIVVDKYAICPLWHSFIDLSIVRSFVHLLILSCWHWPTKPASQPASCLSSHFNLSFHLFAFFHYFSFTFHSFVSSFICSLIHSFYSVWSLTFSVYQMILFLIQSSAFVVQLDILKIYFCSKIDIMDGEVGINRSSHKYAPYC